MSKAEMLLKSKDWVFDPGKVCSPALPEYLQTYSDHLWKNDLVTNYRGSLTCAQQGIATARNRPGVIFKYWHRCLLALSMHTIKKWQKKLLGNFPWKCSWAVLGCTVLLQSWCDPNSGVKYRMEFFMGNHVYNTGSSILSILLYRHGDASCNFVLDTLRTSLISLDFIS